MVANVTMMQKGVSHLLNAELFGTLIKKVQVERVDIQVPILRTCYNCIRRDSQNQMPSIAIENKAIEAFATIADSSSVVEVQVGCCECIMMLWYLLN
jgi:hypothetical protein